MCFQHSKTRLDLVKDVEYVQVRGEQEEKNVCSLKRKEKKPSRGHIRKNLTIFSFQCLSKYI